jgi:ribosomal protein L32
MFFFIGGIQPKTVKLDDNPRMCPSCGLYQARLQRVDHYISIFFIPIIPVKKGIPFFQCQSCGAMSRESGEPWTASKKMPGDLCPKCGRPLEKTFSYCPYCGSPV